MQTQFIKSNGIQLHPDCVVCELVSHNKLSKYSSTQNTQNTLILLRMNSVRIHVKLLPFISTLHNF